MKKLRNAIVKALGALLAALLCVYNTGAEMEWLRALPRELYVYDGATIESLLEPPGSIGFYKANDAEVSLSQSQTLSDVLGEGVVNAQIKLYGVLPVGGIQLTQRDHTVVMPGGLAVGIHIVTDGLLVVGFGQFETSDGYLSPAKLSGVKAGDVIVEADSVPLKTAAQLSEIVANSTADVELLIERGGRSMLIVARPLEDVMDGKRKLGLWIRDDTAGIGTLSMVDMTDNGYGALGHAVRDADTGAEIQLRSGVLLKASIMGVSKSVKGTPGEIKGSFSLNDDVIGSIRATNEFGIYGFLEEQWTNPLYPSGVELAYPEEARLGRAQILASVDDSGVAAYECRIVKVYRQSECAPRGMVIEVTDERLLDKTGGVVQGMSGSPLLQDGKLLGVVTHVLINEPAKGYCLYAYWMYKLIESSVSAAAMVG
ncbi:MAG: SpoIVB peptidase [Clostridia bacterium]|nr:SpoIVB peptidase [Clostridia bacterium]